MATPGYNRARDFGLLLKNLSSFSDNQARVVTYDEDQLRWLDIEIRPNDGRYKGGAFFFQVRIYHVKTSMWFSHYRGLNQYKNVILPV